MECSASFPHPGKVELSMQAAPRSLYVHARHLGLVIGLVLDVSLWRKKLGGCGSIKDITAKIFPLLAAYGAFEEDHGDSTQNTSFGSTKLLLTPMAILWDGAACHINEALRVTACCRNLK